MIHCAGKAGVWGPYRDFYRANVLASQNLLEASRRAGVRRFLHFSSPSVYFDFRDQLNLREEDLPSRPADHYARTKLESERIVLAAHAARFRTLAFRPRLVIGAGDRNVLPRLISLQRAGKLFDIGSPEVRVSVTSVGNLLHAVDCALLAPDSAYGEVYNLADAEPVLLRALVDQVLGEFGLPRRRRRLPRALMLPLARLNERLCRWAGVREEPRLLPVPIAVLSQSMTLNIDKARARLGYSPEDRLGREIRDFAESVPGCWGG